MKAIRFRDVRPGDTVEDFDNPNYGYEIERVRGPVDPHNAHLRLVTLHVRDRDYGLQGSPDKPLFLLHRPWPEGETEADMLDRLRQAARRVGRKLDTRSRQSIYDHLADPAVAIAELREALDAYELGKPSASE